MEKPTRTRGDRKLSEYRLEMRDVVKTFPGVKALDHVSFELRSGEVMALATQFE